MTIPAPLAPPTPAEVDVQFTEELTTWFTSMVADQLAGGSPPVPIRAVVVAWTNHDGTMGGFFNTVDPTRSGAATVQCRGLVAEYGAVTVRVYQLTPNRPTLAQVTQPDAVQAAANDPAQWVAPE
jgi:hypothetical protein